MCTGIQVKTKNGAPVYARTMEFGINLMSQILVIPKGTSYTGIGPKPGHHGKTWQTSYAIAGISSMHLRLVTDGVNSEGLTAGAFYFTNYAGYMEVSDQEASGSICSTDLCTYLLSTCANVAEVKEALKQIKVNTGICPEAALALQTKDPVALHYKVHDAAGNAIVIEYIKGVLHIHDNPIGVLTNNPEFEWHQTNLANYINLSPFNKPAMELKNLTDAGEPVPPVLPMGQGTGFLGLPGDFTPPSRFIRAVAFSQSAEPQEHHEDAVLQAFHILNSFDIPLGTVREIVPHHKHPVLEYTQWTVATDMQRKRLYFHTVGDRSVRMVDLANWKFSSDEIVRIGLKQGTGITDLAQHAPVEAMVS